MSHLHPNRIELLDELQELALKNIITDRPNVTTKVRRENRQLKRMLKEIKKWQDELKNAEHADKH